MSIHLAERAHLADLCNSLGVETAVEVGTHQGVFADAFMDRFHGEIYLVDPWRDACVGEPTFYPCFNEETASRDEDMEIAQQTMSKYGERARFVRMTSEEASRHFTDRSLGFVYLDGMHDYENISRDIRLWWPKLMPGGIFAGHDYWPDALPDVVRAVDEFVSLVGAKLNLTEDFPASWWLQRVF